MNYALVELVLPLDCIADCAASGAVDDAVAYWLRQPVIASQLDGLSLLDTARILYGYGAWEAADLADLETNLGRILWLAAGDCRDNDETSTIMEVGGYDRELAALTD